jgi:uncharacterized protein (DUF4415 family)
MPAKKERITRVTLDRWKRMKGKTDWGRLDAMTDEELTRNALEDPDAQPWTDEDWKHARWVPAPGKNMVTIRIDRDVLKWFQRRGKGYQTRINAVLRAYVAAQQSRARRTPRRASN